MNDIQTLFTQMSELWRLDRAASQLTLGGIISLLETMDPEMEIQDLPEPHSYRGYYSDLSFEPSEDKTTVAALLLKCKGLIWQTFTGYKGGEFVMDETTPLWISYCGTTGVKLVDIRPNGEFVTEKDTDDE